MNGQRVITALVALSLIVVAALTIRTAVVTSAVVSSGKDLSDYGLRHPNAVIPISTLHLSDYGLRHPNARIVVESTPDLSDYVLRHPDARIVVVSTPDLSDYALRHPELWRPATPASHHRNKTVEDRECYRPMALARFPAISVRTAANDGTCREMAVTLGYLSRTTTIGH